MRKIIIILSLITLAYSYITFINEEKKVLIVSVAKVNKIKNVEKVLLKRFYEYPTSLFYKVESKIVNNNIEFTFLGGIPENEIIKELLNTKGKLEFKAENNYIIVTNNEIVTASSTEEDQLFGVAIQLNEKGARSIHTWTSRNIGKNMLVVLDGEIISRSRVSGVLGKRFKFTSPTFTTQQMRYISMYLRTGVLESKVTVVE